MTVFKKSHSRGLERLCSMAVGALAVVAVVTAPAPVRSHEVPQDQARALAPEQAQACPGADVVRVAAVDITAAAQSGSADAFSSVVDRHADVGQVALFALGPYRRALPASMRDEYVQLARQFISRAMARHAGQFAGADLQIVGCASKGSSNLVQSSANGRSITWRIAGERVADVNVGGVWLAQQMRSTFVSVIKRGNGNVAVLLDYLRSNRVAAQQ